MDASENKADFHVRIESIQSREIPENSSDKFYCHRNSSSLCRNRYKKGDRNPFNICKVH